MGSDSLLPLPQSVRTGQTKGKGLRLSEFCQAILPGRLDARPLWCQSRRLQKQDDLIVELRVSIQNHVTVRGGLRKCFAQLLDDPGGRRVTSHVAVQDLPAPVLDDEETVEQPERHRRYGEEFESDDDLT